MGAAPRDAGEVGVAPPWWPVTTTKFVVMTLGTLGLYHYYWLYDNWKVLRERGETGMNPVWRTFFAPITAFRLFERAAESAAAHRVRVHWSAIGIAVAYFAAHIAIFVGVPAWLTGPILLLPVLPVQITMARVNAIAAPGAPRNGHLSLTNLIFLAGGAALTAAAWTLDHQVDLLLKEWNP